MKTPGNNTSTNRSLGVGLLILLIVGAFLGFRSQRAVTAVLEVSANAGTASAPKKPVEKPVLQQLIEEDSLLSQATLSARNPFIYPRATPSRTPRPRRDDAPPPETLTIRMLMYAEDNPEVIFDVNGVESAPLRVGGVFEGWTVVDIQAHSVTVRKGDEERVLSRP